MLYPIELGVHACRSAAASPEYAEKSGCPQAGEAWPRPSAATPTRIDGERAPSLTSRRFQEHGGRFAVRDA